ncbi:cobyrinate a,c-diamide synthase [Oleidesulfovibrio sp.]|uniref:cobyrinate a,c-diamide synthase n=1 Tax=Oleidesulfovibrio sp. TaxID=2909707 RepID=UPI003A8A47E3
MRIPRVIIAGLNGGSGKTIVSLGVSRAWALAGRNIKPFKKGPDYIDARWLALATENQATNLDPFLVPQNVMQALFWTAAQGYDGALIEGNRGLFDGKDVTGSCSTAEVARLLNTPVVLVMNCTKMTRTAAAILSGMVNFEQGLNIAGVVLNNTATDRHRAILRSSIEQYTDVPVLGALPRMCENPIPERHMGLWSDTEMDDVAGPLNAVAAYLRKHVDVDRIWDLAAAAPEQKSVDSVWDLLPVSSRAKPDSASVRIGYVRDAALWFYYEENLEALRRAGAELVELSLLDDAEWPELDGLYLGGGFPETLAEKLAANEAARNRVRRFSEMNMPVYAECGGFMYLGAMLRYEGREYPMSGVFPVCTTIHSRPQGLGYVEASVVEENPFHAKGTQVRGHEFHYSRAEALAGHKVCYSLKMERGEGMGADADGLVVRNTFASYTHLFALGEPHWALNFVNAAREYKSHRTSNPLK